MSRIRTIKPEFFRHEKLFDAEMETGLPLRIAFAGLWTVCDRAGRFEWRPRSLKHDVLPYDNCDFDRVLLELEKRNFILRYKCDGNEYGYIPSWEKHQVINNRERASDIPAPPTRETNCADACPTRESNYQGEGKGRELEGEQELEGKDDDDARARNLLTRVCEILRVELRADPERLTWGRQIREMLRDQIPERDIIRGAEEARKRGIVRLQYVRECALSPPKMAGPPKPSGDEIGERLKAKWAKENEQAGRLRGGAEANEGSVFPAVARGSG